MTATGQIPVQQYGKAMKKLEALAGEFEAIEGLDIARDAAKKLKKLAEGVRNDHDVFTGRKRKSPTKDSQTESITEQAKRETQAQQGTKESRRAQEAKGDPSEQAASKAARRAARGSSRSSSSKGSSRKK